MTPILKHSHGGFSVSQDDVIASLQARIRDLEAALGLHNEKMALTFRLPPQRNQLLGLLLALPTVSEDTIQQRLELATDARVAVFRLRKHLEPFGVVVSSRRHIGYWLEPDMKERVRQLIATAAEPPAAADAVPTEPEQLAMFEEAAPIDEQVYEQLDGTEVYEEPAAE
jgi:hypothetical protein